MAILYILLALIVASGSLPASAGEALAEQSAVAGAEAAKKSQPLTYMSFIGQPKSEVLKHFTKDDPNWDFQFWKDFADGEQSFDDSHANAQFVFDKGKVTMVRSCKIEQPESDNAAPSFGPWMNAKGVIKPQPQISVPQEQPEQVIKHGLDVDAYMTEVISRLKKNFHPSQPGVGPIVRITIDQEGSVQPSSTGIFKKSGDPAIDKLATDALKATVSYPPLGPGWNTMYFGCQLNMATWTWLR